METAGHPVVFAVLGHPIGHSLSPIMHQASFQALGYNGLYLPFDVHPDKLGTVLPAMQAMGFGGVNLTIPLKQKAFELLEDLHDDARRLGAVNTVEFTGSGSLRGHNTDSYGFLRAIDEAFAIKPEGMRILVLGCGGAGRTVAIASAMQKAASIALADTDCSRINSVAKEINQLAPHSEVISLENSPDTWQTAATHSDLIIQATPVGMKPDDPALLPIDVFNSNQYVFDLIYMYPATPLMQAAGQAGAHTANGLGMLLHQGARAFTIWTGKEPDTAAMRRALEDAVYNKK